MELDHSSRMCDSIDFLSWKAEPNEGRFVNEVRVCYGEIGCLRLNSDWFHPIHRPINVLPFPKNNTNTEFMFYSSRIPNKAQEINIYNPDALNTTNLNPDEDLKILIHGYNQHGDMPWFQGLRNAILEASPCSVIVVNWESGRHSNSSVKYAEAAGNARVVALELAFLIRRLKHERGVNLAQIHLIGHSLGAQVASYTGNQVPGIERITGLDPAEPFFFKMPSEVRLDTSDANFVEVIHTNGKTLSTFGYGMIEPCGHLDFYVNGGTFQPGCLQIEDWPQYVLMNGGFVNTLITCSHMRSVYVYTAAVSQRCKFIGYSCPSWEDYEQGRCGSCGKNFSDCAILGPRAAEYPRGEEQRISMYLATGAEEPFCMAAQYRLSLHLPPTKKTPTGNLNVTLVGNRGQLQSFQSVDEQKVKTGKFECLLLHPSPVGDLKSVRLDWTSKGGLDEELESVINGDDESRSLVLLKLELRDLAPDDPYVLEENLVQLCLPITENNTIQLRSGETLTILTQCLL